MKKLRNHLENIFLSLLNRWYFFQNISFKEKTCFFFPISILTQRRTVNFWTHVDRLFITSLLNKFHKWPLIFVGPNFHHLRKKSSLTTDSCLTDGIQYNLVEHL